MAFDYRISLQVHHPVTDPAEIEAGLGLTASLSWKAGERRSTPAGTELPGFYRETYCVFHLAKGEDGALAKRLRDAVNLLQPKKEYLDWLHETGGRSNFYIGWVAGERGENFDVPLLSDIAQLGIQLGIEPYRVRQQW